MSVQSRRRLLQYRQSQFLGGCKTQRVAVVADMLMRSPSPSGNAPLMMSREAAPFSHKTKRGLLCQPGKPLGGLWLKREYAVLRAGHHVASLWPILDARQDMNWLARGLGCRTRAGSRRGGLGGTTGRLGLLGRSRRDGWLLPVLREQAREIRHLLLQRGDLSLQGVKPLGQGQQRGSPRWQFVGTGSKRLLGERGQAALMPLGQQVQILSAHPFLATIVRMAVQSELGLRQPAMQRFGIDAQASGRLGHRDKGHRVPPFVWNVQQEQEQAFDLLGKCPGSVPGKGSGSLPGAFPGRLPGLFLGRKAWLNTEG